MNTQHVAWTKSSANGYGHHHSEREPASNLRTGKVNSSSNNISGVLELSSRDRLMYITTCLIGHQVEVQILDGAVFSGIFHATNVEPFGIILKMAHLIKDGSRGQRNVSDSYKRPARTLIIPAADLVQVIAKEVPVTRDGLTNELHQEKPHELLTDSRISQSRHVEIGRELERWVPDEDITGCPELDDIFDGTWKRGWDQFEANATLFGVKSTFDEELYTTRLERGPQMRELEREALRIAREIEGEDTLDLHLAEERGLQIAEYLEVDEETRFSSVPRCVDDVEYEEMEDRDLDSCNDETFGCISRTTLDKSKAPMDMKSRQTGHGGAYMLSKSSHAEEQLHQDSTSMDVHHSGFEDNGHTEKLSKPAPVIEASRTSDSVPTKEDREKHQEIDPSILPGGEGSHSLLRLADERPGSSTSSTSGHIGAAASVSGDRGLSSSSSVCSLKSEKSTLNPHAKEFKLNPKAKSFVPSVTRVKPSSPVSDNPFYYHQANVASSPHMHGLHIGVGQPVMFNPQGSPIPQPYYHPNVPQYGQPMMVGQPSPVLYMPTYPTEMSYKGRDF